MRKAVELSDRVDKLEKDIKQIIDKMDTTAYNYLVRQILGASQQVQEYAKSINLMKEFIDEKELGKTFEAWLDLRFKAIQEAHEKAQKPPVKPEPPMTESEKKLAEDKGIIKLEDKKREKKLTDQDSTISELTDHKDPPEEA